MSEESENKRKPLTDIERQQIRFLVRWLFYALVMITIASSAVAFITNIIM